MKKIVTIVVGALAVAGCLPEEFGDGNGLTTPNPAASFTISPVAGQTNTYALKAEAPGSLNIQWDLGEGPYLAKESDTISLPDAGTYTISLNAFFKGGASITETQDLVVETSDPEKGNLVLGSKFETTDDISKWTIVNINPAGTEWTFANGQATVDGGGWQQKGIYQALKVIEGKTYSIDLFASSTSGVSNTWFEVYCSTTMPVDGSDYTPGFGSGPILRSLNSWAGCSASPFSGRISVIGCSANDNKGQFTAPTDPDADNIVTMYLVIKCGGEDLKDGISIDNVEVRGI